MIPLLRQRLFRYYILAVAAAISIPLLHAATAISILLHILAAVADDMLLVTMLIILLLIIVMMILIQRMTTVCYNKTAADDDTDVAIAAGQHGGVRHQD